MRTRNIRRIAGAVMALSLVAAACGGDDDDEGADIESAADDAADEAQSAIDEAESVIDENTSEIESAIDEAESAIDSVVDEVESAIDEAMECDSPDPVKFQMQWATQSQFAGYYAALDQGYFDDMCLDVELIEGGVDIQPHVVLGNGDADFAVAWVPKALAVREGGANIVDIAQIFQRSGTLQVSFKDANITSPADFAGKRIGNWGFGNEYEVFAALGQEGLDPASDVTLVGQDFNMTALLEGEIDAAEAMIYNEYAQVLEAVNPDTGELYTPDDFNVISYDEIGVGMLQDSIWADGERLANDAEYKDIATRLVAASIQGWIFCRDNPDECLQIVLDNGPTLGESHQRWQLNEVNQLIWPAENNVGYIDPAAWDRTADIAQNTPNLEGTTVLTAPPDDDAYTNEIVEAAWALLGDADLVGAGYTPVEVTLNEGGA